MLASEQPKTRCLPSWSRHRTEVGIPVIVCLQMPVWRSHSLNQAHYSMIYSSVQTGYLLNRRISGSSDDPIRVTGDAVDVVLVPSEDGCVRLAHSPSTIELVASGIKVEPVQAI